LGPTWFEIGYPGICGGQSLIAKTALIAAFPLSFESTDRLAVRWGGDGRPGNCGPARIGGLMRDFFHFLLRSGLVGRQGVSNGDFA
jgi:hypothetical protein